MSSSKYPRKPFKENSAWFYYRDSAYFTINCNYRKKAEVEGERRRKRRDAHVLGEYLDTKGTVEGYTRTSLPVHDFMRAKNAGEWGEESHKKSHKRSKRSVVNSSKLSSRLVQSRPEFLLKRPTTQEFKTKDK